MEEPSPTITTITPPSTPDLKSLLDAANSASEKVAVLHIAFLALCAYILVIAFSTTHMDLLIGKGVKLPVVDVEVPIVGFYAVAPYLLVLVHFNLLFQLQLVSSKLYAFDDAAKPHGVGGLHGQLNIFPYNYYLVGQPSRLMAGFLALVVTITVLLLPLIALLTLQARFLAYQSELVTWVQRVATWLDVVLVTILWPVIMDRGDSWHAYRRAVWERVRLHWLRWLWGFVGLLIVVFFLRSDTTSAWLIGVGENVVPTEVVWFRFSIAIAVWFLLLLFASLRGRRMHWLTRRRYVETQDPPPLILGLPGLLTTLIIGLPLPLILLMDGEQMDRPKAFGAKKLDSFRHLHLPDEVLVTRPAKPETLADLRSGDPEKKKDALRYIQGLNLQNRSLRNADLSRALLPKADLHEAQLRGARLGAAHLQDANLSRAELGDADLTAAQLQGANLERTRLYNADLSNVDLTGMRLQDAQLYGSTLRGANLTRAYLQGVDLGRASMQGAILTGAYLQGANLVETDLLGARLNGADLRAANLTKANLKGTNLREARLQGANLDRTEWNGADLQGAKFYANSINSSVSELVDVRGLKWQALNAKELEELLDEQYRWGDWPSKDDHNRYSDAIRRAAETGLKPPHFESCLRDSNSQVTCNRVLSPDEFHKLLLPVLEKLACQSTDIANGILWPKDTSSTLKTFPQRLDQKSASIRRLALRLRNRVNKGQIDACPGITHWITIRRLPELLMND